MKPVLPHVSRRILSVLALSSLFLATACSANDNDNPPDSAVAANATPISGGTLRAGIVGGSSKDTLDAHSPVTHPDQARVFQLYATLTDYDTEHKLQMALADALTPSEDAKTWTVTLKPNLRFSDGRPLTAKDVVATFKRITDPKDPKAGATAFANLDRDNMQADGDLVASFPFTEPITIFPDLVAQYSAGIVPVDYDPKNPVASGPFMPKSFTAGQQSTFAKNPHYFREGQPYLDEVTIIDFPDDTARVNALLGGQVDAIDQLPLGQINIIKGNSKFRALESPTGSWIPFTMRVDKPPFDDPKVRQAFRLIVDRQEMIDQVLGGHGTIGNDIYAPFDACYAASIPQRKQDIAQAKKLLAEAGKSNLTVELITSPVAAGLVEAAQVFAQQALEAGVTVKVKKVDPGDFYGDQYLQWTFAQDFWFTRDFLAQATNSGFPTSPYNETHWDNTEWTGLANQAMGELNETTRCSLIQDAQKIEYDLGGNIIWGFPNSVDAHSAKVHGFTEDKSGIPLTSFGFRNVWVER